MSIKLIEGKILCSGCGRLLEKREPYKLNEFQYKVVCMECDIKHNFSKNNYVNCNTPLKRKLLDIIQNAIKDNKTITLDMDEARKRLVDHFSTKNRVISKEKEELSSDKKKRVFSKRRGDK